MQNLPEQLFSWIPRGKYFGQILLREIPVLCKVSQKQKLFRRNFSMKQKSLLLKIFMFGNHCLKSVFYLFNSFLNRSSFTPVRIKVMKEVGVWNIFSNKNQDFYPGCLDLLSQVDSYSEKSSFLFSQVEFYSYLLILPVLRYYTSRNFDINRFYCVGLNCLFQTKDQVYSVWLFCHFFLL